MPMAETDPSEREQHIRRLYRATPQPEFVDVPDLLFLSVDGHGDPNTDPRYADAVHALYAVSYAVKFAIKHAGGPDHKVAPLEGLWWAEDMTAFSVEHKAGWDWTMMIRQPDDVTLEVVAPLAEEAALRKGIPLARELHLNTFTEGRAAQVLHVGPYAAEAPTIASPAFVHP